MSDRIHSGGVAATGSQRCVVVHGGARDGYQVAAALHEAGLLESLVTDLFCSGKTLQRWQRILPRRMLALLAARSSALPASAVRLCAWSGLLATALERCAWVPFVLRRTARRFSDARLGQAGGRLAAESQSLLLAYSYFATPAFRSYGRVGLLFQVHPHPLTVRRLLQDELDLHPECGKSLRQEWELALPAHELQKLVDESQSARAYLVASTFTRDSLVEHGVPPRRIHVVPYGVDLHRFHPGPPQREADGVLRLLFVGRINQRKGILYLLQALSQVSDLNVHLTVCGRVVDDLELFAPFRDRVTVRPSVSEEELVHAYQQADLFVFPSVAEGFGQVLLEALACGLPILSTTHTAAPDLIEDGVQGWIVEPRDPAQLADRIRWAAANPGLLREMACAARKRAELYTLERFRQGVLHFVLSAMHTGTIEQGAPTAELVTT